MINHTAIDFDHLHTFTGGDQSIEREVLGIFAEQADIWVRTLENSGDKKSWAEALHTLKGSARGVGAWRVADICEHAETLTANAKPAERSIAIGDLKNAIAAAVQCIDRRFSQPLAAE